MSASNVVPMRAAVVALDASDRVGVVGKTGSGKSNWAKDQIAGWLRAGVQIYAFDPLDEYSVHGAAKKQRRLGPLPNRVTVADLEAMADPCAWLAAHPGCAIVPADTNAGAAEDLEFVAECIRGVGDCLFVLEEMGLYSVAAVETLNNIFCRYRHDGIAVVGVAQRAIHFPLTSRSQLSQYVSFLQTNRADLKAIADELGDDFAAEVATLPRGAFRHWRDSSHSAGAATKEK